ncbi:hypothetical protein AUP42_18145 [Thalassospira lucentensis]|uniref:Uncharacterized protein n=1 Tax=Thalassospira lucentensis TaxID=168935 RepID=A0A154L615_9PROT|nr:hypothetical protein AUP42_18145 [Thalassospira lucentensis]
MIKSSFRAKRSADPESMPDWKRLDSRLRGNDDLLGNADWECFARSLKSPAQGPGFDFQMM